MTRSVISAVRANLIERPTVSQSVNLFSAIVKRLIQSFSGKQELFRRQAFRDLMMAVHSVGGYRLLDCLATMECEGLPDRIITANLQRSERYPPCEVHKNIDNTRAGRKNKKGPC